PPDTPAADETPADTSESRPSRHHHHHHSSGADRVAIGESIEVKEGEEVADVVVILGSAVVNGKVTGDFVVVGGSAELGPKAEVDNDLVVVGGVLKGDPEAKVGGKRVVLGIGSKVLNMPGCKGLEDWIGHGLFLGRPLPPQVRWSWIVAGIFLALYLLLAVLFPGPLQA